MAYFEGEWKRRPAQRPTGVQFSTDISRVIRTAREQQQQRASDKRRLAAAIVIESAARGFLTRRRLVRQRRVEFQSLHNALVQNKRTGEGRWRALQLFTSFALPSSAKPNAIITSEDLASFVQICHQAVTRWRNDFVVELHAKSDKNTVNDKRRTFSKLLSIAAYSMPLLLGRSDFASATGHSRQDLNTIVRFLDVFTDAKAFGVGSVPAADASAVVQSLLLQMINFGSFSKSALFKAESLLGSQIESAAAVRAKESRQPKVQIPWNEMVQLEADVIHRNVVTQITLRLLFRPLLYTKSISSLVESVNATICTNFNTKPREHTHGTQHSEFLAYIKNLFTWSAYDPVPFRIRHLSTMILPASSGGGEEAATSSATADAVSSKTLFSNMSFVLKTLFASGLDCAHCAAAKDAYDNFFYYIMHDDDEIAAANRRLSLLFTSIQLQQAWSAFEPVDGNLSGAVKTQTAGFQNSMLDIISVLLKSTVIAAGIEAIVNEDVYEENENDIFNADGDNDVVMRDDNVGVQKYNVPLPTKRNQHETSSMQKDKAMNQLTSAEQNRITALRQMCVAYLTTHQDFQRFYIECFVSVASSLSALVLSSNSPNTTTTNLRIMDEQLALSIWHSPAGNSEYGKTNGDVIMTLISVYYGLMQIGSTLQLYSYVRNSPLLPILWAVLNATKRDVTGRGRFVLAGAAGSKARAGVTPSTFGGFGIAVGTAAAQQRQQQQSMMDLLKAGTVMPLRECHDFVICLDVFCAMMEPLLLSVHDRDFYETALTGEAHEAGSLVMPALFTIQERLQQQATGSGISGGLPFNSLELALIARDVRSVVIGMAQLAFASNQRRVYSTSIMNTSAVNATANLKTVSQSWNDTEQWWSCFLSASALLRKLYDRDQRRPFTWLTYAYDVALLSRQHQSTTNGLTAIEKFAWDRQSSVIPSLSNAPSSSNKLNLLILPEIIANSASGDDVNLAGNEMPINIIPSTLNMPPGDKNQIAGLHTKNLARFGDDIVRQYFKIARPFQPPSSSLMSSASRSKPKSTVSDRSRRNRTPLDFEFAGVDGNSEDDFMHAFDHQSNAAAAPTAPPVSAAAHSADELAVTLLLLQTPFVVPFVERVRYFHHWLKLEHRRRGHDIRANFGVGPGEQLQAVRRDHIYEDAFEQLSHLPPERFRLLWSVTFRNLTGLLEAGIDGGGLFREFCNLVMKEGLNPHRGFFQLTPHDGSLLPNATVINAMAESGERLLGVSVFDHLRFLGRMLGKCLYEMLLVEVRFARFFLRQLLLPRGRNYVDIHQLQSFDPEMYRNLMQLRDLPDVRVLDLDFTVNVDRLGQTRVYELKPGGSAVSVTNENRNEYIHLYADFWLNRHARRAVNAVKMGLEDVIPYQWLALFAPHELQMLMSGVDQPVDVEDLKHHTHYSGLYNDDHPVIKNFWSVVRSLSDEQKRLLLKFVTSCSRPPLFGFKELHPPFTIQSAARVDGLPTASTCMNLLKLPEFIDAQTLRAKLVESITSGAGFELS